MSARCDYPGNPIDHGLVVIQGDCIDRTYEEIDWLRAERDTLIARRDEIMRAAGAAVEAATVATSQLVMCRPECEFCTEPHTTDAERRVLDAVANWHPKPNSPGALMRLMGEAAAWLADPEARR